MYQIPLFPYVIDQNSMYMYDNAVPVSNTQSTCSTKINGVIYIQWLYDNAEFVFAWLDDNGGYYY